MLNENYITLHNDDHKIRFLIENDLLQLKLGDVYSFHNENSDSKSKRLYYFKHYLEGVCKKYGVIFTILEVGNLKINYIDHEIFIAYLMEMSTKYEYPYVLDFMDSILKFHEHQNTTQIPTQNEILERTYDIFNSLQNSDKISFLETLYSSGDKLIKEKINSMGNVNFENYKSPISENMILKADAHWWDRRMKIICETIKFLLVPYDDEEISDSHHQFPSQNFTLIQEIMTENEDPLGYEKCISLLLQSSPKLAVKILKQPEFEPILHGAFYGGRNIQEKIRNAWTIVKVTVGIGDHKFDKLVVPHFTFLNDLLGVKCIYSGKTLRRDFHEMTEKYKITEINSREACGAIFDLRQSMNLDFENEKLRRVMKVKQLGDSGDLVIPQLFGLDAANVGGRSHTKYSTIHRVNCGFNHAIQDYAQARNEGWFFGADDSVSNFQNFVKPLINDMHHIESNFVDPLSGRRYEVPFFCPNDGPVINTSLGVTQSYNSTYCNRYHDGVTKDEVIMNHKMWPSQGILSLNIDLGYCRTQWEENLSSLKGLGRPYTPRDCQNIVRKNKTCVIGPPKGICSLFYSSPLRFRFSNQ